MKKAYSKIIQSLTEIFAIVYYSTKERVSVHRTNLNRIFTKISFEISILCGCCHADGSSLAVALSPF